MAPDHRPDTAVVARRVTALLGIPLRFQPATSRRRWIWLTPERPDVQVEVPRTTGASHVVLAHFSTPSEDTRHPVTGMPTGRPLDPGRHLADYSILTMADTATTHAIRRRLLEIVQDGHVVAQADAGRSLSASLSARLPVSGAGWIAARVSSPVRAWHIWPILLAAHTSPVYLAGDGPPMSAADAAYLRTILDGGFVWIDRFGAKESRTSLGDLRSALDRALVALSDRAGGLGNRP